MLALFLGFTKRRQEAMLEERGEAQTRPVLEHYSIPFLDQMIAMVTAAAIISYAIYAIDSPLVGSKMLATAPSVVYGVFRYLYLIYDRRDTRSTAAILTEDPGMVFAGVTWIASFRTRRARGSSPTTPAPPRTATSSASSSSASGRARCTRAAGPASRGRRSTEAAGRR